MRKTVSEAVLASLLVAVASSALAQGIPTTQPTFLHIFREQVKPGRSVDHAKWEAGWPAAFEKANSKYNYVALASVTGPAEVWYVTTLASQAAYGEMLASEKTDAVLSAELDRLHKGDGEFLNEGSAIQAVSKPALSHGEFPDIGKMRFWEITTYRVKPGYGEAFEGAVKAYMSAVKRAAAPSTRWRTYEVVAGAPGGTYLIFSSVASFADFDKEAAEGEAIWNGRSEEEGTVIKKFFTEGLMSSMTNRYRLDPVQSFVPKEVRASDPAFWSPGQAMRTAQQKDKPAEKR